MSPTESSYAHCRAIAKARARNFYYSFLALGADQRNAMCAIYAFMRRSDDLADSPDQATSVRRASIGRWRGQVRRALEGKGTDSLVLRAFRDAVERFSIPNDYLFALLDGMERDLSDRPYETFDDLYDYCYQAASVVGMTTIHVLGFEREAAIPLAEKCGVAFQLTNILRDVSSDAAMGRVYFPSAELREFGLSREEVLGGKLESADERFQRFMGFQWRRADRYYTESAGLLPLLSPAGQPCFWAMVATYRGLLGRIRSTRYAVLGREVGLPAWQKLWILGRAFHFRLTGGLPPFPA